MLDLSTLICPLIAVFQQVIDAFFSAFSFLGVSAPQLTDLLSGLVTCTT